MGIVYIIAIVIVLWLFMAHRKDVAVRKARKNGTACPSCFGNGNIYSRFDTGTRREITSMVCPACNGKGR
jgi:DnaJ-class molecular chaperone